MSPLEMNERAITLAQEGNLDEAVQWARAAVCGLRQLVDKDDLGLAVALTNLGTYCADSGRTEEALRCYEEGMSIKSRTLGEDEPSCAKTRYRIARCRRQRDDLELAEVEYRRCIEILDANPDASPPIHLNALRELAILLAGSARNDEALTFLRKGVRLAASRVAAGDLDFVQPLEELAIACIVERDFEGLEAAMFDGLGGNRAAYFLDGLAGGLVELRRPPQVKADSQVREDRRWSSAHRAAAEALQRGDAAAAREMAEHAVRRAQERFGDHSLEASSSHNLLAVAHQDLGNGEDALRCFRAAADAVREGLGPQDPLYPASLYNVANGLAQLSRLIEAAPIFEEIVEIRRNQAPPDPSALAIALQDLAATQAALGDPFRAAKVYAEAQDVLPPGDRLRDVLEVRLRMNRLGQRPMDEVGDLTPEHGALLQEVAAAENQPEERIIKAERLFAETREYVGETSFTNVVILHTLGRVYHDLHRYEAAIERLEQALEIARAHHSGPTDPPVPGILVESLAGALLADGRLLDAEPLFREALAQFRLTSESNDRRTLACLNAYGVNLFKLGRYGDAEAALFQCYGSLRELPGAGEETLAVVNNLAALCRHMGRYAEAEAFYREAIDRAPGVYGEESREHALALNNAALLHADLGRNDVARDLLHKARAIQEKTVGRRDPDYARILNNLGALDLNSVVPSQVEKAEAMLAESADIRREALGEHNHEYHTALHNVGLAQLRRGRFAEAACTFQRALELTEAALGANHPSCARTIGGLALAYDGLGESERALGLLERSTSVSRLALGDRHPAVARALGNEGLHRYMHGDAAGARPRLLQALEIRRTLVRDLFPGMTESERALYWDANETFFGLFAAYALQESSEHPELLGELYDNQIFGKALQIEMLANTRRSLAESDDTEVVRLYEQWLTKKREIASRVRLRGATRGDSVAADRLSREVEMLEKELTTRSASFAERQSRKRSTWRDVQRSLEPGEAAAEIIRIPHGDLRSKYDAQPVYAALILTPNTTNHPRLVQLGEALTLEGVALDRYLDFRDTIWGGAYEAFWRSMEGGLEGVRRLYLAPDGVYGRIDLNILFDEKRQSFLMDSLDLRIVASTRDALKARRVSDRGRTAVLVGRPAYDRAPAEASADSARAPAEDLRSIRFHPQSGERLHFRDLAGTEREVSEIDALLCDRGWKVTVLLGECASRASLLSVESPTVLHIATHGFYLDPGEIRFRNAEGESILMFEDSTNLEAQPGFAKLQEVLAESGFVRTAAVGVRRTTAGAFPGTTVLDPLLRSGLALAGASREILSTDLVADDGILTAYDATGLELERTELVVLSACESGRGELRAAEGAFGMERALRAAGAKTILATLWPVDDAITRELMAAFYASWLESGDARAALRASQQQLRLKYRLPMLWGGFVLIGR